jgi:hypothetical protein
MFFEISDDLAHRGDLLFNFTLGLNFDKGSVDNRLTVLQALLQCQCVVGYVDSFSNITNKTRFESLFGDFLIIFWKILFFH